jgi:hypothetical protein
MIKYSFQGYDGTGSTCTYPNGITVNGDAPLDTMISVVAHELVETVTDPEGTTWMDANGYENADKCVWRYGNAQLLPTGARYNVAVGSQKYLIQDNWDLNKNTCVNSA